MPSAASPEDREFYATGMCHAFAVALHRRFGWTIHLVLDQGERYWEDPEDPGNWIPAVVHAYAVDGDLNAWDIFGMRPFSDVRLEAEGLFAVRGYDSEEVRSEDELRAYVGFWADEPSEPIDRPLADYDDRDVDDALRATMLALGHLPGFPGEMAAGPSLSRA